MSLSSVLGLGSDKKVRYAIVALGDISQESLMPGVKHTGNSVITALVTGDPTKAAELAKQYDVPADAVYGYDQFPALLSSGKIDALYLATPNFRHAEFAVPALKAGVHVLLEKPMEISVARCQEILDAQKASGAKLMVAYRLHFEPATLAMVELLRAGKLGTVLSFSSSFSQPLKPSNHRAKNGVEAGPVFDMGPYPINAVRNLFGAEPIEAFAVGTKSAASGLPMDFDHTVAVTLKFSEERLATFVVSYVGDSLNDYTVIGTEAVLRADPAYTMGKPLAYELSVGGKKTTEAFKNTDHFGGELKNFSDCVLNGTDVEPDGEEGLLDVRVIEAIVQSLKTNRPVALPPRQRSKRIDTGQAETLRPPSIPTPVNTEKPSA